METIDPNTRIMKMLLLLWVLLVGSSVFGSPLEMQLLDMMLREAEDYPSNGRDQRDISVLPAASIGCDDSGDSQEPFSHIFDDYEEDKEECLDFLPPCEPAFDEGLPIEHPCFVRLLLLKTPLLKQDPCANFTLAPERPPTTAKPKTKKCNPKRKASKSATPNELLALASNGTIASTTDAPLSSTTETSTDSKIIKLRKLVPKIKANTTTSTTTTTVETTTVDESTSPAETSTTEEATTPETTTEQETTSTPTTTTSSTTSTTQPPFTENQLKRLKALRNRRKNSRAKSPKVPDPPQIKLDNASQPSEVIQVIMTTEAAELKLRPEVSTNTTTVVPPTTVSTTTSGPETTTSESCDEDITVPEFSGCEDDEGTQMSENIVTSTTEAPCEDTDEQDTNLCPQFMPNQGPASPRPPPSFRFRKPVKNYVEPILYEGNFAKPLQRMAPVGPQQRDYFVSNKQIVPRPRPKYRKRIPPSIYMNNIVRGLDCSDEVAQSPPRTPNQPQRFWGVSPVGFLQRSQALIKQQPERNIKSFAPVPIKRTPFYPRSSEETVERQYMMERDPEPRPQYHHYPEDEVFHEVAPLTSPAPSLDPCLQEHDHVLFRQRPHHQQTDHLADYPQAPTSAHCFT
ncbi:mediator of DNA damage checkpoint protein 1 [Drosophila erecta]|uniref:Chitin-binding type-2 domain-containing protein n=1 Tax=Drosophila erecta TaxID=7220 RepID=B3N6A8_DROER|nr:mediator of DNA damage checkpoint protein 1 [Drosophila erecta]EDV59195.2 uncharacterized protein Dere_GG23541 [Drosophila erecta]